MNLRDILVMEVPSGALKEVIKERNIESKLNSTEDMAAAIAEDNPTFGSYLADQFKYAGSTAVNLNIAMRGVEAAWSQKDYFKDKLRERFSAAIFDGGIRPNLEKTPKLISAHDLNDKLVLAFSFLGPARRFLENFQIVSRSPQMVDYVIIHFSPFAVEVRASQDRNLMFRDSVAEIMGKKPEDIAWEKATKLTEEQANKLAVRLNARLRSAKHKMTEGPYATKEVTARTQIEDLQSDEQYRTEFNNQPMKKKTLRFDFEYSFGYSDTISYEVTDEGLWIRSKVGEEVISYIIGEIMAIRYPVEIDAGVNNDDDSLEVDGVVNNDDLLDEVDNEIKVPLNTEISETEENLA